MTVGGRWVQQRSTDASGFADALRQFGVRTQKETETVLDAAAAAVYDSIVNGSPITNAPGQPVDQGDLVRSWKIRKISATGREVVSDSPYARAIEHNWRRIARAKIKAMAAQLGFKRLSKANVRIIRKGFAGLTFRRRGGAHSVKLTKRGFPALLSRVVAMLYPNASRNVGGNVRARGVGIQ